MGILNLSDSEKILSARAKEYVHRALERGVPVFTDFLSDRERAVVLECSSLLSAMENTVVFGGYDEAERTMIGFFPDYAMYLETEELYSEFPVALLSIECSGFRTHTHRDYLGSILALGIERCVIGDIIVGDKGYSAYVVVHRRICDFILENLKLIGRDGANVKKEDFRVLSNVKREFQTIRGTCASMRVDALISEALCVSRDKAQNLVSDGFVSINHEICENRSRIITVGDILTVRGFGKFRLSLVGDVNRKGRTRFELQKYI